MREGQTRDALTCATVAEAAADAITPFATVFFHGHVFGVSVASHRHWLCGHGLLAVRALGNYEPLRIERREVLTFSIVIGTSEEWQVSEGESLVSNMHRRSASDLKPKR